MSKKTTITNEKAIDLYNSPEFIAPEKARYITLDLYPKIPDDVEEWCDMVDMGPKQKETFIKQLGKREYMVQLLVDRFSGNFNIREVSFYGE